MPKLNLKRTPAEEAERAWRKARKAAKKERKKKKADTYVGDDYYELFDTYIGGDHPSEPGVRAAWSLERVSG